MTAAVGSGAAPESVAKSEKPAEASASGGYHLPVYPFVAPPELRGAAPRRYPVVIVGAGLAGLTAACGLSLLGIETIVIDEDDSVGVRGASSRGICYAQKSLEIFARLGIYERIAAKGIRWSVGRTLAGDDEVYSFDLAKQTSHDASLQPPFINLQQFYIEWFLADRIAELNAAGAHTDLRWKSRVTACRQNEDCVTLDIDTPAGAYSLEAAWVIDCAGVNSPIRQGFGLPVHPAKGIDRWCISDVRFKTRPPAERWTWISAPFNDGRAVWQHLMGDDVWRLDYQMDAAADIESVSRPEVVDERLRRQFGDAVDYELVWVGPYSYRSQMLENFRHGRVLFAGDSAHVMSPFGARGGNSGVQDADNLVWKLAAVLAGHGSDALLDSYSTERVAAARQNIRITDRTNRFLTPHSPVERVFRDAVVGLARDYAFARAYVNTGRLSAPNHYVDTPLAATPEGGRPVQNVPLVLPDGRQGDLVGLLAWAQYQPVAVVFGALDATLAARLQDIEARYPLRVVHCTGEASQLPALGDPDGRLARQCSILCVPKVPHCALLRPDLYLGATLALSAATLERAVRQLLGRESAIPAFETP